MVRFRPTPLCPQRARGCVLTHCKQHRMFGNDMEYYANQACSSYSTEIGALDQVKWVAPYWEHANPNHVTPASDRMWLSADDRLILGYGWDHHYHKAVMWVDYRTENNGRATANTNDTQDWPVFDALFGRANWQAWLEARDAEMRAHFYGCDD